MNTRLHILIIFLLVGIILMPAANVNAGATRIEFTGTEWCDPDTLTAERVWTAGPNLHARSWTQTCYETADIPYMNGTTYLYDGLANVGSHYIINVKFRMVTVVEGVWVGNCELPANTNTINCVGHGEGIYEGLELHWFAHPNSGEPTPFTGYIIDHR